MNYKEFSLWSEGTIPILLLFLGFKSHNSIKLDDNSRNISSSQISFGNINILELQKVDELLFQLLSKYGNI